MLLVYLVEVFLLKMPLKQYASNDENDPLLICDDVYTTGTSMREVYQEGAIGIVVFARNEITDDWIKAIWQMSI